MSVQTITKENFDQVVLQADSELLDVERWPIIKSAYIAQIDLRLDDELAEAGRAIGVLGGRAVRVESAEIPGRDWSHRLAYLEKIAPTPEKYPRKAGVPEKKPLIVTK